MATASEAPLRYGACQACEGRTFSNDGPIGIDCSCGRHFHVGGALIVGNDPIACPSCYATVPHPVHIADQEAPDDEQ